MWQGLAAQIGLHNPNIQTLLGDEDHDEISNWREIIRQELANYIEATGRFAEKVLSGPLPSS